MRQSPEEKYQHSLSAGDMLPDPAQAEVMRRLTDLYQRIELSNPKERGMVSNLAKWVAGFLSSKPQEPERGLYLWAVSYTHLTLPTN